jgi:predicted  nucleic acid-binding Zn-ribbon protein
VRSKAVQMAAYLDARDERDRLKRELDDLIRERNKLREAVMELMGLLEGSAAQNALQRAKDLLP